MIVTEKALMNYKMKLETSVRELKKKRKKLTQKFKKETKKSAEFEVEKMMESRKKINYNDVDDTVAKTEIFNNNPKNDTGLAVNTNEDATITESNKCLPSITLSVNQKPEPNAMSDEEFNTERSKIVSK
jgi:hypothetical protein